MVFSKISNDSININGNNNQILVKVDKTVGYGDNTVIVRNVEGHPNFY